MSSILKGNHVTKLSNDRQDDKKIETSPQLEVTVKNVNDEGTYQYECSCKKKVVKMSESDKIGEMITGLLKAHKEGKAIVRVEIEFS